MMQTSDDREITEIPDWMYDESQVQVASITNHLSFTNKVVVKRIYNLARILHNALTKSRILYWTSGGTLLGCVRHQGLIPWDDDLDLCIYNHDEDKINLCLKTLLNSNGCDIVEAPSFGYKVFHKTESETIPGGYAKHRYPFCDIFVMKRKGTISILAMGAARTMWPDEYYNNKDIDNIQSRLFGDLHLNCPRNPEEYLQRTYGELWYTEGSTHNYDHVERYHVNPVKFKLKPEHYEAAKPFI